jgi:excisionase family DNA binding protein
MKVRSLEDYLRVGEAAVLLGVTTKTLRNWDRLGKLKAERHPINDYRIYTRKDIEAVINRRVVQAGSR